MEKDDSTKSSAAAAAAAVETLSSFYEFTRLCERIGNEASYTQKVEVIKAHLRPLLLAGGGGKQKQKLHKRTAAEEEEAATVVQLTCGLLLCKEDRKRVYNLRDRNMAKLMARHWKCPVDDLLQDIAEGDVSETARRFFASHGEPCSRSTFTLQQVEGFLDKLAHLTKEDDQYQVLASIIKKSTADDLKWIIRIIDKDLRIKVGAKYVLGALHDEAFEAYRNSANLKEIVSKVLRHESLQDLTASQLLVAEETGVKPKPKGKMFNTSVTLMSPVKPMIASPIKSIDGCMKKCPRGMFAEIKYDGERIQIHKKGDDYAFYSRNLKKMLEWKVAAVKDYITESTKAESIILDGEILLMDTKTDKPLPFGSLSIHKKNDFQDATVCLFLFDILYVDGKVVMNEPLKKRRQILEESVTRIPHRIEFSEYKEIADLTTGEEALSEMMDRVLKEGLEGLMIKDIVDVYKPDKRHWLKLKKGTTTSSACVVCVHYLAGMADSADLVVLGAYFGTGAYGGMMSVFLMGSYDTDEEKWKTVCKVGNGFDDAALKQLQKLLRPQMKQIFKSYDKVPSWLDINRLHVPDFVVMDPEQAPIWEVAGQGFTDSKHHTTLSIRFPRVTRIRDDKDFSTHTDVNHLRALAKASAEGTSMTAAKTAAKKASGIGPLEIKGGGKPVAKASTTTSSSSSSSSSKKSATITSWMGKPKAKPGAKPPSGGSSTPEGLTVVKAPDAGGSTDLRAALIKAGAAAQKPGASADDRRTMLVHCVNNAGAMSADFEDRLGLFWAQSARDAWTQHALEDQEEPLGEIQMTKLKKTAAEDDDDGVAGKLWLINAIAYESAATKNSDAPSLGKFSTAAFESAMGMVAAIAKVRKAAVVLALVTRPKRADAERHAMLRIVAQQLLAKKVHVVVYEIAAADEDADGEEEEEQYPTKTTKEQKKKAKPKPPVRGDDADGSGSDTEDMDDDALEELFKSKSKSKQPVNVTKKSHVSVKPSSTPVDKAATTKNKAKAKAGDDDSGSDTEDMELDVDAAKKLAKEKRGADAGRPLAAKEERKPSESDSDTEEMDMEDIKPHTTATSSTTKTKPIARQGRDQENGSGSDTEEMDVEQEKAKTAKAKEEVIIVAKPAKRARAETAPPEPAQKRKKARREESAEEKRKKEERRVSRLLRGVGVVFGAGAAGNHDAEAERKLTELIEAMGGTVSENHEWLPYGARMSTHLVIPSPVADAAALSSSSAVKHADQLGGKVVRADWVTDCWREKRRLHERLYFALPQLYLEDDDESEEEDEEDEDDISPADDESEEDEPEAASTTDKDDKNKKGVVILPGSSSSSTSAPTAVSELPSIFTGFSFYFYGHNKKKDNQFPTCGKSELERYAVAYGAEVSEVVTEETTHVISWRRSVDDAVVASAGRRVKVVSPHWAWDAINTATRRPEQPYLLLRP